MKYVIVIAPACADYRANPRQDCVASHSAQHNLRCEGLAPWIIRGLNTFHTLHTPAAGLALRTLARARIRFSASKPSSNGLRRTPMKSSMLMRPLFAVPPPPDMHHALCVAWKTQATIAENRPSERSTFLSVYYRNVRPLQPALSDFVRGNCDKRTKKQNGLTGTCHADVRA